MTGRITMTETQRTRRGHGTDRRHPGRIGPGDPGALAGDAVTDGAALDDLRWHYGEAYLIELIGVRWVAQRRDSHATMSASSPDRLLDLIRADYAVHPVPRD